MTYFTGTTHTCNLLHRVEYFQFFRIKCWDTIVLITLNKEKTKSKLHPLHTAGCLKCCCGSRSVVYPVIPVTRKCRLPWIFVQFMKLSILEASTVSLVGLPVPSQTGEKKTSWKWAVPYFSFKISSDFFLHWNDVYLLDTGLHTAHNFSLHSSPLRVYPTGSCWHTSCRPPRNLLKGWKMASTKSLQQMSRRMIFVSFLCVFEIVGHGRICGPRYFQIGR